MSNIIKFVGDFFTDKTKEKTNTNSFISSTQTQKSQSRHKTSSMPKELILNNHPKSNEFYNNLTNDYLNAHTNKNNITNISKNLQPINSQESSSNNNNTFDIYQKRKEIKENISEESIIKIFGENKNFTLDLKVFGRSIFQNLILTANAFVKNEYKPGEFVNLNIPIKCIWKRFKNETEISISNINTNSYIPTAEDIGYTILVEAFPIDKNIYGDDPLFGQYGPLEMDSNIKSTLELLLTSGGTKFSCFLYDNVDQEKKTDKEIIIYINSQELKICEIDYNAKEKELERVKYHHLNPLISLHPNDSQRFLLKFFKFDLDLDNKLNNPNGAVKDFNKLSQEPKSEYNLIAMSKQCRELIYLLIQIFLIDEKIKNTKLFTCANYNLLPQETKNGVTDLITEIKTLREENNVLINNMKYLEYTNGNLKKEMKDLEQEFQISLETINNSMRSAISNDNIQKRASYPENIGINQGKDFGNKIIVGRSSIKTSNQGSLNNSSKEILNYSELKIKFDDLKELNLNLISKEKALREENQELILKLEINKNNLADLTAENKKVKSELNQLNIDILSINKNSSVLLDQKNKIQNKLDLIEKECEDLSLTKSQLEATLKLLENEGNSHAKSHNDSNDKKLDEFSKKNETLSYELKNLIIQRNLLTTQKDILTKELEKFKKEKLKNENSQADLFEEIENLKEIIKEKEKINLSLNNTTEKIKKDYKEMKEKYEILEIEHQALKENYDKNFYNFNNEKNTDRLNDSSVIDNLNSVNKMQKISSEEYEEFEMLRREKEESDALVMQLKSNNQAKDMEIAALKKIIDGFKKING